VHHIVAWYHGGPTVLGNLILLCGRHHHLLHRQRWRIVLHDDATVTFTLPDGRIRSTRPPPRIRSPAAPAAA
jgi:predicted restriction endonuclease